MLQVSETAMEELLRNLDEIPEDVGYRLTSAKGKYRLTLDRPMEADRVLRDDGRPILMIDAEVDAKLVGVILELKEDAEGPRLALEPFRSSS